MVYYEVRRRSVTGLTTHVLLLRLHYHKKQPLFSRWNRFHLTKTGVYGIELISDSRTVICSDGFGNGNQNQYLVIYILTRILTSTTSIRLTDLLSCPLQLIMNEAFTTTRKATKPEYDRFIRRTIIRDMGSSYLSHYYEGLDTTDTKMYKDYVEHYRLVFS